MHLLTIQRMYFLFRIFETDEDRTKRLAKWENYLEETEAKRIKEEEDKDDAKDTNTN